MDLEKMAGELADKIAKDIENLESFDAVKAFLKENQVDQNTAEIVLDYGKPMVAIDKATGDVLVYWGPFETYKGLSCEAMDKLKAAAGLCPQES